MHIVTDVVQRCWLFCITFSDNSNSWHIQMWHF